MANEAQRRHQMDGSIWAAQQLLGSGTVRQSDETLEGWCDVRWCSSPVMSCYPLVNVHSLRAGKSPSKDRYINYFYGPWLQYCWITRGYVLFLFCWGFWCILKITWRSSYWRWYPIGWCLMRIFTNPWIIIIIITINRMWKDGWDDLIPKQVELV